MKKLKSADNVIRVLFTLKDQRSPLGLTEITNKTNISKSTVYNILNTLIDYGLVKKDNNTKKYTLGISVLGLSSVVIESLDVRNISKPYMQLLAEETSSTVTLGIRNNEKFTFIERVNGVKNVRFFCDIGKDVEFFKGAASKAYFANLPKSEQLKIFREEEYNEIELEIMEILKNGYSKSNEEVDKGVIAFGAPIFNYKNEVVAGIAIANIVGVLDQDKIERNIAKLVEAALCISNDMGKSSK